MEIRFNIKPTVITSTVKGKYSASYPISYNGYCHGGRVKRVNTGRNPNNENIYVFFNYQKFRRKVKRYVDNEGDMVSKVIRDKYWVIYIYEIPESIFRLTGTRGVQHSRHFTIEKNNAAIYGY